MSETYNIKLPQFEGPFDLLLFFIERDELDVHDIPIAKLTNEFLGYIKQMERLNIELASEFILVAATLMRVKAKMLLPRKDLNELGEEIDPRAELVQKILEYKKFKEVVKDLKQLEELRMQRFKRGNVKKEIKLISDAYSTEAELESINLFKLMGLFNKILTRLEERHKKANFALVRYPYTIREEKDYLLKMVTKVKDIPFEQIFANCQNKIQAIYRFLSLLELAQERTLAIRIGLGINNFWISQVSTEEEENTSEKNAEQSVETVVNDAIDEAKE